MTTGSENGKDMNQNCSNETIQLPVQLDQLSEKCKLKLQEETTTYTPTWLNGKLSEMPGDGEDVELEHSYSSEGCVKLAQPLYGQGLSAHAVYVSHRMEAGT